MLHNLREFVPKGQVKRVSSEEFVKNCRLNGSYPVRT